MCFYLKFYIIQYCYPVQKHQKPFCCSGLAFFLVNRYSGHERTTATNSNSSLHTLLKIRYTNSVGPILIRVSFKLDQNPSFAGSGSGFIPSFLYSNWIRIRKTACEGPHLMDPTWSSKEMTLGWTISRVKWDTALDTESSSFASVELTSIRDHISTLRL